MKFKVKVDGGDVSETIIEAANKRQAALILRQLRRERESLPEEIELEVIYE